MIDQFTKWIFRQVLPILIHIRFVDLFLLEISRLIDFQQDHYASPLSLPPPSATPRSVASGREEPYMTHLNDTRISHRPSIASKKSMVEMGPPSTMTSYHLSSVESPTPYTPQTMDNSRVQPSLQ